MQKSYQNQIKPSSTENECQKDSIKFVKNKQLDLENCFVFTFHYSYTKINM